MSNVKWDLFEIPLDRQIEFFKLIKMRKNKMGKNS